MLGGLVSILPWFYLHVVICRLVSAPNIGRGYAMAKGQLKSNKEAKKPKKEKPKVLATAGMAATTAAPAKKK